MAGEDIIKLPPGFRFYPKDEEIISCYLKPKILGQKLPCNFMDTIELYGPDSTPWKMFDVNSWMDSHNNLTERFIYVFTTLSKLRTSESNNNNKATTSRDNTSKKAGCGTWSGKTNGKIRDCEGNVIGERRLLVFEVNDIGAEFDLDKAGYFKMHEYSLAGINKGLKSSGGDLVLCRITYDSSKTVLFKLPSKSSIAHGSNYSGECQNKNENLEGSVGVEENVEVSVGVEENLEGSVGVEENLEVSVGVEENLEKSVKVEENREGSVKVEENLEGSVKVEENLERSGKVEENLEGSVKVEENLEKSVRVEENLEGAGYLTSKSVVETNTGVGDNNEGNESITSVNLFELDNGFCNFDNYLADNYDQYDYSFLEFDDFPGDPGFDISWFNNLLTSGQEDEQVEDSSKLGKRKLEEENLYGTSKKMCL